MWPPDGVSVLATAPVERFLRSITTTEGRLAVSGTVILLTLIVSTYLAPRTVRWVTARTRESLDERDVLTFARRANEAIPASLTVLVIRTIQLVVLGLAAIMLLVVWGRVQWAVAILQGVGESQDLIVQLATTVVIVLVTYASLDILSESVGRFGEEVDRITAHQEEIIRRLGQLAILALAVAMGLTLWGVNLSGLLVGAGFLGIVIGFAARQTLGSLIAGFVLMFSRPFTIGDWVEIGDQEGIVTDITIVNTRLENFDGEFVIIPNDSVANTPITNRSRKGHYRIRLDVGVDYETDPEHARDVALDAIDEVAAVEPAPPPQAVLKDFGDSAVVIELRFWIDRPTPPRMWQATNGVVESVKTAFDREGIKIPFPQRELSGRAETGGFRVQSDDIPADVGRGSPPAATDEAVRQAADETDQGAADESVAANGDGAGDDAESESADDNAEGIDEPDEDTDADGTDDSDDSDDADGDDEDQNGNGTTQ